MILRAGAIAKRPFRHWPRSRKEKRQRCEGRKQAPGVVGPARQVHRHGTEGVSGSARDPWKVISRSQPGGPTMLAMRLVQRGRAAARSGRDGIGSRTASRRPDPSRRTPSFGAAVGRPCGASGPFASQGSHRARREDRLIRRSAAESGRKGCRLRTGVPLAGRLGEWLHLRASCPRWPTIGNIQVPARTDWSEGRAGTAPGATGPRSPGASHRR